MSAIAIAPIPTPTSALSNRAHHLSLDLQVSHALWTSLVSKSVRFRPGHTVDLDSGRAFNVHSHMMTERERRSRLATVPGN